VLKEHFPGVRLSHDVCAVEALPDDTELLVAGFPCIDVSRAGLRRGLDGQSTGLVRHVFRLLQVAKDRNRPVNWVLLENVEALLDRADDQPPAIAFVVQQLMDLGFSSWAYRVVSSAGFGVPMRRRRVFIVASLHGDARDVLLSQGMQSCPGSCKQLFEDNECYECHLETLKQRNSNENVSFAIDMGCAICRPGEDIIPSFTTANDRILLLLADGRTGMLRVEDAERLQGFPEGWTKPCFPVTVEGVSAHKRVPYKEMDLETHSSRRWQLLGNAVTVHVARWLGERLMHPYAHKYRLAQGNHAIHHLLKEGAPEPKQQVLKRPNVWSFITADEIQEAAIFSFKESREFKRAKLHAIQDVEQLAGKTGTHTESPGAEKSSSKSSHTSQDKGPASDSEPSAITPMKTGERPAVSGSDSGSDLKVYKDAFQARMVKKIKKGLVQSSSKEKVQTWEKSTWPKSAWWQNGIGAFAVKRSSEYPITCPYQALDDFIEQVGRSPSAEEKAGYIHRLREKGWDISNDILRRMSGSSMDIASKSVEITRLKGIIDDSEMVGAIVWVPEPLSGIYWPGEVLDPQHMPLGRTLPKDALSKLTPEQKKASITSLDGMWDTKEFEDSEHRRVLVLYFPINTGKWQWHHPDDLLPWDKHRSKYEKEAHAAIKNTKFKYSDLLGHALQDALESHKVKQKKSSLTTDKMRQTRAAAAAASVDLKSRCGRCRTCMNAYVGTKRHDCLTQRMTASALGGHAGAQLAICGEDAIGARIAVWWDGDEEYFEGVICWYDPVSTEHTVAYDDGEIGMHRLWQHDEHIVIQSDIEDWPGEAAAVRERLKKAMQEPLTGTMTADEILNTKRASELASRMPIMTTYEFQREENVRKIREKFKLFLGE